MATEKFQELWAALSQRKLAAAELSLLPLWCSLPGPRRQAILWCYITVLLWQYTTAVDTLVIDITIVTIVSQYGDIYHNSNYLDSNVAYPGEVGRGQKGLIGEGILGRDPSSNNNQLLAFVGKCFLWSIKFVILETTALGFFPKGLASLHPNYFPALNTRPWASIAQSAVEKHLWMSQGSLLPLSRQTMLGYSKSNS